MENNIRSFRVNTKVPIAAAYGTVAAGDFVISERRDEDCVSHGAAVAVRVVRGEF
jgi:hypothetical protein